jgi:hypothetical protein
MSLIFIHAQLYPKGVEGKQHTIKITEKGNIL